MNVHHQRLGYLWAVLATAVVLALRYMARDILGEQALMLPFVLAVMAAAWWGGLGPGLLATGLSLLAGLVFLIPPEYSIFVDELAQGLNAAIFVVVGITVSLLSEALHTARRQESEKQFRTLANSMPQLAWMARPDGHKFWFNQRWYEYTGTTPAEMLGWGWQTVYRAAELPRVLCSWTAALRSGTPWEETAALRRYDGAMRWHLSRAMPVRDDDGKIVRWFGTNTDISDRLEMEEALKEADRCKDQFLATLAHELRNPLAPISNALELWPLVAHDPAEVDQLRAIMRRQVRQMTRLIEDLMDVSRVARGKIQLRYEPVELADAIACAVESVRPQLDACHHALTVRLPQQRLHVRGDLARLTQVFGNLLHNAVKFTGEHGQISITAEIEASNIVVRVCDNGPGIPPEMLAGVFEMFRQVEGTLGRSQGGLGIGLTLVKQLVELHGGTVEAHSDGPGAGSEFVVRLPLLKMHAESSHHPRLDPSTQQLATIPCHQILVVDDNVESAQTLAMMLRVLGQTVEVAHDGPEALDRLHALRPDVVLLDIGMPGMDGLEVARRIRQRPELDEVVLAALTGYGQPADRRRALDAGFNEHLTKPVSLEKLRELLTSVDVSQQAG